MPFRAVFLRTLSWATASVRHAIKPDLSGALFQANAPQTNTQTLSNAYWLSVLIAVIALSTGCEQNTTGNSESTSIRAVSQQQESTTSAEPPGLTQGAEPVQEAEDLDPVLVQSQALGWWDHLASYTQGWVGATEPLRITFAHSIINSEQDPSEILNQIGLNLIPEADYVVTLEGDNSLLISPESRWQSGVNYQVSLQPQGLPGVSDDLAVFSYQVKVIEQDLELSVSGMAPATEKHQMLLQGELNTRDRVEKAQVESLLSAHQFGQSLPISWQHKEDGISHAFEVINIVRGEDAGEVELRWDGNAIGVDKKGMEPIKVPALNQFAITGVRSKHYPSQMVEVSLSEPVDRNQNLNGLIRLAGQPVNAYVDGNKLMIEPSKVMSGEASLNISDTLRSAKGLSLASNFDSQVLFVSEDPGVRYVGEGSILPAGDNLSVSFEAINVNAVWVTAFKVYGNNLGQFLQQSDIANSRTNNQVGRYLWRKKMTLPDIPKDQWQTFDLDVKPLLEKHSDGIINIGLSIDSSMSVVPCESELPVWSKDISNYDGPENYQDNRRPSWFAKYYGADNGYYSWRDRDNPCKAAYYRANAKVSDSRNFLLSDMGLMAKRGTDNQLHVVVTRLSDAEPLNKVRINAYNFQNQLIAQGQTDDQGLAELTLTGEVFYLIAEGQNDRGYLRLPKNQALPVSQFDVAGSKVKKGLQGYLYGERDVWRPGDTIYLNVVLRDALQTLPKDHPVSVDFFDPRGKKVATKIDATPVGSIYSFEFATDERAPTGSYRAVARVGGEYFDKLIRVETFTPNRLKVELTPEQTQLTRTNLPMTFELSAQWLHGATAKNLKADSELVLSPMTSQFDGFSQYTFDDPAREFRQTKRSVYSGVLNDQGQDDFRLKIPFISDSPGKLQATFVSRVFEPSGEFSRTIRRFEFLPYDHWVGLSIAKGEGYQDAISRDVDHPVRLIALDAKGQPQANRPLDITVYKLSWRWWWDQSPENMANYIRSGHARKVDSAELTTDENGRVDWQLAKNSFDWGRHLVRVCDALSGHCSGQEVYLGWSWNNQLSPNSATELMLATDKPTYQVGDVARIKIPEFKEGRALLSLETGSKVLSKRWLDLQPGASHFDLPITEAMAPNIYANLTLLLPHSGRDSETPMRLYGIVPVRVEDPKTQLTPIIHAPATVRPEGELSVRVTEQTGRAMSYSLVLVDEGLLGATGFQTPNPQPYFYRRQALGVQSWDMFDGVVGAYGGNLERLLRIGGGNQVKDGEQKKKRRFEPVVKYLGTFELPAGADNSHSVRLPPYMGEVRLMAVAATEHAYGSAQASVKVTQPLTLLATLPRVLGPGESVSLPVSVFANSEAIKSVTVTATSDALYQLPVAEATVDFDEPGDAIAQLQLAVADRIGFGSVTVRAESRLVDEQGIERLETAEQIIHIESRPSNPESHQQVVKLLQPGETWQPALTPLGMAGTNAAALSVSQTPALNLTRRLDYLIRYPHGCLEQTTSAIFPQIGLHQLIDLSERRRQEIQDNVSEAVNKYRSFQRADGGFSYWPGDQYSNEWASVYATHFLVAAKAQGYAVPLDVYRKSLDYLQEQINDLSHHHAGEHVRSSLAYGLYVAALAGKADLAAMNRLRESIVKEQHSASLSEIDRNNQLQRWQLALAYHQLGLDDIAQALFKAGNNDIHPGAQSRYSYGSSLRDQAIRLMAEHRLADAAKAWQDAETIAEALSKDHWYSTQTTAWALMAMADFSGGKPSLGAQFSIQSGSEPWQPLQSRQAHYHQSVPVKAVTDQALKVRNDSDKPLYALLSNRGIAKQGVEVAENKGLTMTVSYQTLEGKDLDISELPQGQDFVARVSVSTDSLDTTREFRLEDLALSMLVPSGWQIRNTRLGGGELPKGLDYQDIRDDRLLSYFSLWRDSRWTWRYSNAEQTQVEVEMIVNASYAGEFYLPGWSVEAMYDNQLFARTKGQWVKVIKQ